VDTSRSKPIPSNLFRNNYLPPVFFPSPLLSIEDNVLQLLFLTSLNINGNVFALQGEKLTINKDRAMA
jgi:hypothetical protein